ncbi:hypothetical protein AAVH_23791 [Aphelenchoides avenae]|nr:hypothetical protein AAVH_23791 [Aphelenchus avenae]
MRRRQVLRHRIQHVLRLPTVSPITVSRIDHVHLWYRYVHQRTGVRFGVVHSTTAAASTTNSDFTT